MQHIHFLSKMLLSIYICIIASPGCFDTDKISLRRDEDTCEGAEETVLYVSGKPVKLTRKDAKEIENALIGLIRNSPPGIRQNLLPLGLNRPGWIDSEGLLRVGLWRLSVRRDRLTLIYTPPGLFQTDFYIYNAKVEKSDRNIWIVSDITRESVGPPR